MRIKCLDRGEVEALTERGAPVPHGRRSRAQTRTYPMIEFEKNLVEAFDKYEKIVKELSLDRIGFDNFLNQYDDFYLVYALDGHESDEEEQELLDKYARRIDLHKRIYEEAFQGLCSDEDAKLPIYIDNGRFGSKEATRRIKVVFEEWSENQKDPV